MTSEETRLREVLHDLTPQPPRPLGTSALLSRLDGAPLRLPPARSRTWIPVVAAAAVVVAAAAVTIAVRPSGRDTGPATPAPTTSLPTTVRSDPGPRPSTPTITPTVAPSVGPFGARLVVRGDVLPGSLVTDGTSLYGLGVSSVVRIDPARGIVARAPRDDAVPGLVITRPDDHLWVVGRWARDQVRLTRYALPTLAPAGSVTLALPALSDGSPPIVAASPDGRRLYVGGGREVAIVDAPGRRVITTVPMPQRYVSGLAVSPDGRTLYVDLNSGGGVTGTIEKVDLATGAVSPAAPGFAGSGALVATNGGLWVTGGSGHVASVWFVPLADPTRPRSEPSAGGGYFPTVTVLGGVAWIGAYSLACADAATGHVRASGSLVDHQGDQSGIINDITRTGDGRYYGVYIGNSGTGIVRFTSPAACR